MAIATTESQYVTFSLENECFAVPVEVVREMKDADLFLRGIAHWVGFRRKAVSYWY